MDKSNFAFTRSNYILLIAGIVIILIGYILMSGSGTNEEAFNPEIFGTMRIKVAPMVSLFGFLFIIVAILWKGNRGKCAANENINTAENAENDKEG